MRRRAKNPISLGPPPSYHMGGFGTPSVWEYRGREITIRPPHSPGNKTSDWRAEWEEYSTIEDQMDKHRTFGVDEQSALANARHEIDVIEKSADVFGYAYAEGIVQHVVDAMVDHDRGPIDRAAVARKIQELHDSLQRRAGSYIPTADGLIRLPVSELFYFYDLPLRDRLKLIDEVIAFQVRSGFIEPARVRNPRKRKASGGKKKKNPKAGSILRKMTRL